MMYRQSALFCYQVHSISISLKYINLLNHFHACIPHLLIYLMSKLLNTCFLNLFLYKCQQWSCNTHRGVSSAV